jgi:sterol desaturase/sphingolipid hydroxylase (fatty acid hydroxylase superfamily)
MPPFGRPRKPGVSLKSRAAAADEAGAESADPRYSARMSPLRIAGFVLLGFAALFAFGSLWYAVMDVGEGLSLYDVWQKFLPASLNWVQRSLSASLWNGIHVILIMPAWAVVGVIGLLCIGLGRKRHE